MSGDVSARARLIASAVRLFQAKGYAGVGVAEILAAAKAPKGCLYHHFPTGKEGLAAAAVAWIGAEVEAELRRLLGQGRDVCDTIMLIATATADWLARTDCQQGALIGTMASGVDPTTQALGDAVNEVYGRWRALLAAALPGPDAQARAGLLIASLEGAILMARAQRAPELVVQTMRQLTGAITA